jgi:hypothetical protein
MESKMRLSICLGGAILIGAHAVCFAQATSSGALQKAARVRIDLPDGWESRNLYKAAAQSGEYPELAAYFELFVVPKSDYADNVDLKAWAQIVKENAAKRSTLVKRKDTELRERKIDRRATLEYEVTGEFKGAKLLYQNFLLESGDYYCKLMCWTTPSHWKDAQPKFDELVGRIK